MILRIVIDAAPSVGGDLNQWNARPIAVAGEFVCMFVTSCPEVTRRAKISS